MMTRSSLYYWLFFLVPLFYFLSLPHFYPDVDIWLAQGLAILKHGTLFPPEEHIIGPVSQMIYPSWGASLLYALIYKLFSPWGREFLDLFHKLILVGLLSIFYFKNLRQLRSPWSKGNLFFVALAIFGFSYMFVDRPAFLALVPFLLFYYELEKKLVWNWKKYLTLFLVAVVWINIHGSALIVLPMAGWLLLTSSWKEKKYYLFLAPLLILALLCNPFGYHIFSYGLETAQVSSSRFIGEWSSPFKFLFPANDIAYFSYLLIFVFLLFKKRRFDILKSTVFPLTFLGLTAERHIVLAFLLIIPTWIKEGEAEDSKTTKSSSYLNLSLVSLLLLFIFLLNPFSRFQFLENFPARKARYSLVKQYPRDSVSMIKDCKFQGPILSSLELGGWLQLETTNKVLFDARNIIFPEKSFTDFRHILLGEEGWEKVLNDYGFDLILLTLEDAKLLEMKMSSTSEWTILKKETLYTLFGRKALKERCQKISEQNF